MNMAQNIVIKEEPTSDVSDSETNYVFGIVKAEKQEYEESTSSTACKISPGIIMPELSLKCLHDDKETKLPGTTSRLSKKELKNTVSMRRPNLFSKPDTNPYRFQIKVQCESNLKKSDLTHFSNVLKKLYTSKDVTFHILVNAVSVPPSSIIRVSAVFSSSGHDFEPVQRCPLHAQQDKAKGNPFYEFVVQSASIGASYEKNSITGMYSVIVPYEVPQNGEKFTLYGYKLTCFTSCSNGLIRRPFMLVFTLENDGVQLGRQTLNVKVCACPLRDLNLDLKKYNEKFSSAYSKAESEIVEKETASKYSLTVDDPNLYIFLQQMKVLYESSADVKYLTEKGISELI